MFVLKMPNRIRDNEELSKLKDFELIRMKELSILSGLRQSTIKFYAELGILPFQQEDEGLTRRFVKGQSLRRIKEIMTLKDRGKTIDEIVKKYKND